MKLQVPYTEGVCLESMCKAPVFDKADSVISSRHTASQIVLAYFTSLGTGEQADFDGLLVLCLLLSCNCCTY